MPSPAQHLPRSPASSGQVLLSAALNPCMSTPNTWLPSCSTQSCQATSIPRAPETSFSSSLLHSPFLLPRTAPFPLSISLQASQTLMCMWSTSSLVGRHSPAWPSPAPRRVRLLLPLGSETEAAPPPGSPPEHTPKRLSPYACPQVSAVSPPASLSGDRVQATMATTRPHFHRGPLGSSC